MNLRRPDPLLIFVSLLGICIVARVLLWLIGIFIAVVYLGGSSACPQNLCL